MGPWGWESGPDHHVALSPMAGAAVTVNILGAVGVRQDNKLAAREELERAAEEATARLDEAVASNSHPEIITRNQIITNVI